MPGTIMMIDDDPYILDSLDILLQQHGYHTIKADSSKKFQNLFHKHIDLILLDISLPDGNGIDLCRIIREKSSCPIIFLTANIEDQMMIQAYQTGCDDYIKKPFSSVELLLKISYILNKNMQSNVLIINDLEINIDTYSIKKKDTFISLSTREFNIVYELAKAKGRILTKEYLLTKFFDKDDHYSEDNALASCMKRIRKKLGNDYIITVKNIGYQWKVQA